MNIFSTENRDRILAKLQKVVRDPDQAMAWIDGFAASSRHPLEDIGDTYVRLTVAGTEPRSGTLKTLADAASALHVPLPSIALPITQALIRGYPSNEDVVQLLERGVPRQMLEAAAGTPFKKLREDLATGQVPHSLTEALLIELSREFSGRLRSSYQDEGQVQIPAVDDFLREIWALSEKHGLALSHEDTHGQFVVVDLARGDREWLLDANADIQTKER